MRDPLKTSMSIPLLAFAHSQFSLHRHKVNPPVGEMLPFFFHELPGGSKKVWMRDTQTDRERRPNKITILKKLGAKMKAKVGCLGGDERVSA